MTVQALFADEDDPLEAAWDPLWMRLLLVRRRSVVILTIESPSSYSVVQHLRRSDIFPKAHKILLGVSPALRERPGVREQGTGPCATLHQEEDGTTKFRWWRTTPGAAAGSQADSAGFSGPGDEMQRQTRLRGAISTGVALQPGGICWWDVSVLDPPGGWRCFHGGHDTPVFFGGKNSCNPWNKFRPEPKLIQTSFVPISGRSRCEKWPLLMAILANGAGVGWHNVPVHGSTERGTGFEWGPLDPDPAKADLRIHPMGLGACYRDAAENLVLHPSLSGVRQFPRRSEFVSWTRLGGLVVRFPEGEAAMIAPCLPVGFSVFAGFQKLGSPFWAGESAFGHLVEITRRGEINLLRGTMMRCRENVIDPDGVGMPV